MESKSDGGGGLESFIYSTATGARSAHGQRTGLLPVELRREVLPAAGRSRRGRQAGM